jgi:hypothetical protein
MWCSAVGVIVTLILSMLAAEAQPSSKVPRIGFLMPLLTPERAHNLEAFRHRLRELGWIEGQNVAMELRYIEDGTDTERLPELAAALVWLNVDVIVTVGGTTRIAQNATRMIPKASRYAVIGTAGSVVTESGRTMSEAREECVVTSRSIGVS